MWANKNNGFTIVETLITLAISSALFIVVALLIQGQLAKTQARDAANKLEATVQAVVNDVTTGYYPELGAYTCTAGSPPNVTYINNSSNTRGTLSNCVLAGKKITFNSNNVTIDILVANSNLPDGVDTSTDPSTTFKVIDSTFGAGSLTEVKTYPWSGLKSGVNKIYYVLNSNYAPINDASGNILSGSQNVVFYDGSGGTLSLPAINNFMCFDNGVYHTSLSFPDDGSRNVKMTVDDRSNCP